MKHYIHTLSLSFLILTTYFIAFFHDFSHSYKPNMRNELCLSYGPHNTVHVKYYTMIVCDDADLHIKVQALHRNIVNIIWLIIFIILLL